MTETNVPSHTVNVESPVKAGTNITAMLSERILGNSAASELFCIEASPGPCATVYARAYGSLVFDGDLLTIPRESWRMHVLLERVTLAGPDRHLGATGYSPNKCKAGVDPRKLGVEPVTLTRPIFAAVPLDQARELLARLLAEGRVTCEPHCHGIQRGDTAPFNALARLAWTVFSPSTLPSCVR